MMNPNGSSPSSKPDIILRPGASGGEVRKLQERLNRLGYHIEIDGTYGQRTTAAVAHLQARSGLAVDGTAGPMTHAAIIQHTNAHHTQLGEHWERDVRTAMHGAGGSSSGAQDDSASAQAPHPRPEDKPDEATGIADTADTSESTPSSADATDEHSTDELDHDDEPEAEDATDPEPEPDHSTVDVVVSSDDGGYSHDDSAGSSDHHDDASDFANDDV